MEQQQLIGLMTKTIDFCKTNEIFYERKNAEVKFDNARELFFYTLNLVCGKDNAKHLPEYKPVVEWLSDNKGKSLFIMGKCGTGKSLIATKVLPFIFATIEKVVRPYTARTISKLDRRPVLSHECPLVIDDLGCEGTVKKFGSEYDMISEIIDDVDREGYLCVITTNLTSEEIRERYGDRIYDRIRGNFKVVSFDNESNR